MKKIFTLLMLLGAAFLTQAQHSCCSKPGNQDVTAFASLGDDKAFVNAHLAPLPLDFTPTVGKMVNIKAADGKEAKVFEVKSGPGQGNVILMFHEWWGLNEYIQREAERLHNETGFTVLALDLYDGKVTANPDEAGKLMQATNNDRARAIIQAAIDYAGPNGKIQTIGWCFGGGWSLQAALMAGKKDMGCVMYYGMPETDVNKIKGIAGPVLGIFASQDKWITPETVTAFDKTMKDNGKEITVVNYNADHAFANPSNPKYNKEYAEDAHKKAVAFIKKNAAAPLHK